MSAKRPRPQGSEFSRRLSHWQRGILRRFGQRCLDQHGSADVWIEDLYLKRFLPDAVIHDQGQEFRGPAQLRQGISRLRTAFPDFHFTVEDLLADGDKAGLGRLWSQMPSVPNPLARGPSIDSTAENKGRKSRQLTTFQIEQESTERTERSKSNSKTPQARLRIKFRKRAPVSGLGLLLDCRKREGRSSSGYGSAGLSRIAENARIVSFSGNQEH